jgi:hypothetical protein
VCVHMVEEKSSNKVHIMYNQVHSSNRVGRFTFNYNTRKAGRREGMQRKRERERGGGWGRQRERETLQATTDLSRLHEHCSDDVGTVRLVADS